MLRSVCIVTYSRQMDSTKGQTESQTVSMNTEIIIFCPHCGYILIITDPVADRCYSCESCQADFELIYDGERWQPVK